MTPVRSVRFSGQDQQRAYESWLRTFPPEVVDLLAPLAQMAREETASGQYDDWSVPSMMSRPHIRAAMELGKKIPQVRAFVDLVKRLNIERIEAVQDQDESAKTEAHQPLLDLGRALANVLRH